MARLATRFSAHSNFIRSEAPLAEDEMRRVAPSIFAEGRHESRSERYTYIPTIDILRALNLQGFQPFMAGQSRSRIPGKAEYTKHLIRMRHAGQVATGGDANEIILINSHDGASSYQMIAGVFRFVCANGLVCGEVSNDIRVPHKGDILGEVIEGATRVLEDFELIDGAKDGMKSVTLAPDETVAFARAAHALRYGESTEVTGRAPISAEQLLDTRRSADRDSSLWTVLNRVQENVLKGGQAGYNASRRSTRTRQVASIDRNIHLNRALWVLAEEMRKMKANG